MSEEDKPAEDEHKEPEHKEEPKSETKPDPLPDLDKITPAHLAALERKLRDEITEQHGHHTAEVTELKEQLAELQEYKDSQEQAQHDRDKVKDSESTMVLPPNDIPPQQPNPNPETKGEPGEPGKKRSRWKAVW